MHIITYKSSDTGLLCFCPIGKEIVFQKLGWRCFENLFKEQLKTQLSAEKHHICKYCNKMFI